MTVKETFLSLVFYVGGISLFLGLIFSIVFVLYQLGVR
jgi:hypothetical protein